MTLQGLLRTPKCPLASVLCRTSLKGLVDMLISVMHICWYL